MEGLFMRPPHLSWHSIEGERVAEKLKTRLATGLSDQEALDRLMRLGPNRIDVEKRWTRLSRAADQFSDALIWVLLVAALASGFVLGAWVDAAAITAIVLLNATLGYALESRAESALARLEAMESPSARVIRGSHTLSVPARDVVIGDLLLLEAGDQIAADSRLVTNWHLEALEASLTGESLSVEKSTAPVAEDAGLGDRTSMIYAGTTVAKGRGHALVTATGTATEMGRIAESISEDSPPSPLQVEMGRIGRRLALVALGSGILVMGTGLLQNYAFETMALTAVALAVAAIPEGLPAVITATLAGGTRRMAQRNAIVRRLPAVEALGAVDVICTDKTGTITKSELALAIACIDGQDFESGQIDEDLDELRDLLVTAVLCNDARLSGGEYIGDPTETALVAAAATAGVDPTVVRAQHPRIDEATFDSRRKLMSTLHVLEEGGFDLRSKGAPEVILSRCTSVANSRGVEPLDPDTRVALLREADRLAGRGFRTLAFARRTLDERPSDPSVAETDMVYLGVVGLQDEVRPAVPQAIETASVAGVRTVMVTGDHLVTAATVASEVGIADGEFMPGDELREIDFDDLSSTISEYRGFARVDPIDKVKIVEAWRSTGAIVAMTGDGVNDAPALNAADVGVAMGSGTDVSRASADLVLTDDNYATIVAAVDEGRRIFRNLRNVVHYLLSANASEVLYMVIGFAAFGFLGEPLLAVQLLWINLLSDALPALALGVDQPSLDLMKNRPGTGRNILSRRNLAVLVSQGAILTVAALTSLVLGHYLLQLDFAVVRTMVFSTLVLAQLLHAVNVRSDAEVRMTLPQPALLGAIAVSVVLQVFVVYTGFGHNVFQTAPLGLSEIGIVVATSAISMLAIRTLNRRLQQS
jgi:Ca2+-transporting ATPase